MTAIPKLTATAACRVARIDRDRFNEHVAAGRFPCAPETIPGRARLFDPDDMVALCLFRENLDDGFDALRAGVIACAVAEAARLNPESSSIAYVQDYFGSRGFAVRPEDVPGHTVWDKVAFNGSNVRKVTIYNIAYLRALIAHATEEERSIIGPND